MTKQLTISSISKIEKVAKEFINANIDKTVFAFNGSMGAGKTTFIKAICHELGVKEDVVNSPSFAIVNEYNTEKGDTIFHFDFYRIKSVEEAFDMGYEDYLYSNHRCFIEWPEKIEALLPEDMVEVTITEQEDGSRLVSWH